MSEFYKKKRMTRLLGYGTLICVPLVFILSYLFNEVKMDSALSVFLIVLIASAAMFAYYVLFNHIEQKALKKKQEKYDPFNH